MHQNYLSDDILKIATVNRSAGHHRIVWDSEKSNWAFHPDSPLQILLSSLAWNYSLIFPSEGSYGTKMDNGSQFSGILGLLQNQEADIGMGFFFGHRRTDPSC